VNSTFRKWRTEQRVAQTQEREAVNKLLPVAVHEAAHCVAYEVFASGVEQAELHRRVNPHDRIIKNGEVYVAVSNGITRPKHYNKTREDFELNCFCLLAGPLAEVGITGGKAAFQRDLEDMALCANDLNLPNDHELLVKTDGRVKKWLLNGTVRAAIKEIADVLLKPEQVISGDQVRQIVDRLGREEMYRAGI
jgi:hypothetical protein